MTPAEHRERPLQRFPDLELSLTERWARGVNQHALADMLARARSAYDDLSSRYAAAVSSSPASPSHPTPVVGAGGEGRREQAETPADASSLSSGNPR